MRYGSTAAETYHRFMRMEVWRNEQYMCNSVKTIYVQLKVGYVGSLGNPHFVPRITRTNDARMSKKMACEKWKVE